MAVPVKYDVLTGRKLHVEIHAAIHEKFMWLPVFTGAEFGLFSGAWGWMWISWSPALGVLGKCHGELGISL